ncbi:MAG: antitoxin [Gemmatimonadaceae bacterium]|nr:antitoxin [Gloeobacterales cyanobacterium ES-bin-141]
MSRISIEVTAEQHQRLKAFAALRGQTIKEYILERSLPPSSGEGLTETEALHQLEKFLQPRIEAAQRGEFSNKDFDGIIAEARAERAAQ